MEEYLGEVTVVHFYASELLGHIEDGAEAFSDAWLIAPTSWVVAQAKDRGFANLEEFLTEYTHDDTEGWLAKAIQDRVLDGVGTGRVSIDE